MARILLYIAGASMFAAAPLASAQVTLDLTTTQQTNCIAITDANGLALVPGTTVLQATGVALTGAGCGGNGNSNFQTNVVVPATAVTGTPFSVSWAASAAATECIYGGTNGVTGWPVGTSACSGATCAGPHSNSVNVSAAGPYTFNITCTNASGFGQGSMTATGGSPQPQGFALNVPATVTTNVAFQISWAVTGASTCTGQASLNGSSVNLPGWTDSTSATSPRSVTTAQDGVYTLMLTCTNAQGAATSAPAIISSTSIHGNCPAGLQTNLTVCYDANFTSCATSDDVTQFTNIWGRTTATGAISPFPGDQAPIFFKNFDKTKYIAAQVEVPSTGLPINQVGLFTHGGTFGGPNLTMAISQTCGDFSPSAQYCLHSDVNPEQVLVPWKLPTAVGNYCSMAPGQTYYINVKVTNPTLSNPTCDGGGTGNLCTISVQSNHTP